MTGSENCRRVLGIHRGRSDISGPRPLYQRPHEDVALTQVSRWRRIRRPSQEGRSGADDGSPQGGESREPPTPQFPVGGSIKRGEIARDEAIRGRLLSIW